MLKITDADNRVAAGKMKKVKELEAGNFLGLSEKTGYARQHISRVLRGKSGVTLDCLLKIAKASKLDVSDVVGHIAAMEAETRANIRAAKKSA